MKAKLTLPQQPVSTPKLNLNWHDQYEQTLRLLETGNYRFGLMVLMLAIQGCLLTPASLLIFQYYDFGYSDVFAGISVALFFGVLVSNLGLLSIRFCINLFSVAFLIQLVMLAMHLNF